ncbi:MAG: hypothetical protein C5S47_07805 [Candidatus Methanogasteraceae archaeon]|nr:MAG: hypothetical protein C5S47_07805 [ANME-2 cluster archaeon]
MKIEKALVIGTILGLVLTLFSIFLVLLFSVVANSRPRICGNCGVSQPVLTSCTSSEPGMMPLSFGIC